MRKELESNAQVELFREANNTDISKLCDPLPSGLKLVGNSICVNTYSGFLDDPIGFISSIPRRINDYIVDNFRN